MEEKTMAPPEMGLSDLLMTVEDEKTELDRIFEQMTDPRNIAHNTELSKREIGQFSRMAAIAKKYDLVSLKELIVENLTLRVSHKRSGRREWVKITTRMQGRDAEEARGNFFQRFGKGPA